MLSTPLKTIRHAYNPNSDLPKTRTFNNSNIKQLTHSNPQFFSTLHGLYCNRSHPKKHLSLTRKISLNVVCSGPSSRLIRALHLNSPEQVSAEPQNTLRFAFSKVSLSLLSSTLQINLQNQSARLTIKKSQKISRFARPTLTPTFSTLNGPPLTETPTLSTSGRKPQTIFVPSLKLQTALALNPA